MTETNLTPRLRLWHRAAFAVTAAALVVTGSQGVFAGLNANAFNGTPTAVTSGTLKLNLTNTDASAGFTSAISNLVPGDSVSRYVTLTNGGSLASQGMTFKVATQAGDSAALITSNGSHKALQVTVQRCAQAWTWTSTTSTCGAAGGAIGIISATDLSGLSAPVTFNVKDGTSLATMAAGEAAYLKVTIALPDQNEIVDNGVLPTGTVQGGSANLTFTFAELQPTAANTNS